MLRAERVSVSRHFSESIEREGYVYEQKQIRYEPGAGAAGDNCRLSFPVTKPVLLPDVCCLSHGYVYLHQLFFFFFLKEYTGCIYRTSELCGTFPRWDLSWRAEKHFCNCACLCTGGNGVFSVGG